MKITALERTTVRVPFVPGILPGPGYEEPAPGYPEPLSARCQDIVRIRTDAGLTGLGMSGPYYGVRERELPPLIGRDPLCWEPRALLGDTWDMALLDLMAQAVGWPLYRLFGGRVRPSVAVDYWICRMNPEDSAAAARRAVTLGFEGIKLKCKWDDHNTADRVHAIHEAAPKLKIVLDPNERFHTVANTLALARELEGYDVVFEDPIPKTDLSLYRQLVDGTSIPIAPHLQSARQVIEAVHLGAADAVNLGPSGWGFLDLARIAEAGGLPVWQASNVDLGLFDVWRAHASLACPACTWSSDLCGNFVHEHSLLTEPLVVDGHLRLSDRPGLGVELDEDAVARYSVAD